MVVTNQNSMERDKLVFNGYGNYYYDTQLFREYSKDQEKQDLVQVHQALTIQPDPLN